ncbi:MAG: pirin family protein [Thauera sp.]|jgi:redox-sensitive bicupin YhaK (pirin superfamily)|nr:pirin family protein [Thauera sp.]
MTTPCPEQVLHSRTVEQRLTGRATSDGAGVKLTRVLGQNLQRRLDPFLMLDHFGSDAAADYIAGFPDHPHRGFETITYMLAGRMRHRDSAGHEGVLENGGVQWMTAGRGVIHSEMPEQEEGLMSGFQLWLNLPAKDKMCPPWYRDFSAAELPAFVTAAGVSATLIAGDSHGHHGAVERAHTAPLIIDLSFAEAADFRQRLPAGHNAFLYVHAGSVTVEGSTVDCKQLAVLDNAPDRDGVIVHGSAGARVLLVAGQPLNESIAQYGPFVMNTEAEIYQTLADYRAGKLAGQAA